MSETAMAQESAALPLTLTVPEAARLLGISRNHAYEMVAAGKLPALRLGRRLVVPRARLLRLLASAEDDLGAGDARADGQEFALPANPYEPARRGAER